jgi:lipooligosaccharide transport system ATP-binding protein
VLNNLLVYARYFGIPRREAAGRAEELLEFLQLKDRAATKIRTLSGGMKRRLLIARSLVNRPRLLLLDEPTTGLDPQARHLIWQRVRALKKLGTTILLTTHYMEEAAQLCDRVIFIDHGKVLAEGSPEAPRPRERHARRRRDRRRGEDLLRELAAMDVEGRAASRTASTPTRTAAPRSTGWSRRGSPSSSAFSGAARSRTSSSSSRDAS